MVNRRSCRAMLAAAALSCAAGCGTFLGLGDYGEAPGDDASADATPDGTTSAEGGGDVVTHDAPGESANDAPAEAGDGGPDTSDAASDAEGAADASDAAGDAGDAGDASDGSAVDAACDGGGVVCAPVAPSGWQGPLELWEGPSNPPHCGTGYTSTLSAGADASAPPAQCTCSCGTPDGGTCGAVTAKFYSNSNCGTACGGDAGTLTLQPGSCVAVATQVASCGSSTTYLGIGSSTASGFGCPPSQQKNVPSWSWTNLALACSANNPPPAGCPKNYVCVPTPAAPFESHFCVLQAGTVGCPGPFSVKHVYYGGVTDTRDCTACTCAAAAGVDCDTNGHVETHDNATCTASLDTFNVPTTCTGAIDPASNHIVFTTTPTGGSCAPDGGLPDGGVTPNTPTTICCTP